jgi:hypothetical protein
MAVTAPSSGTTEFVRGSADNGWRNPKENQEFCEGSSTQGFETNGNAAPFDRL